MEEIRREQFEKLLQEINNKEDLIEKLVAYLENNNLLEDFLKKIYYTIEKSEPVYKIRYYKDENGKLLGLYDIKNSDILINRFEGCSVYVYDEIKTLFFAGYEINKIISRQQENSKSYNNLAIKLIPLNSSDKLKELNLINFIKSNPLIFVYVIAIYNVDLNELDKIDTKSFTYKKEIKNN